MVVPIREEKAGGGRRGREQKKAKAMLAPFGGLVRYVKYARWKGKEHGLRLAFLVLVSAPLSKGMVTRHRCKGEHRGRFRYQKLFMTSAFLTLRNVRLYQPRSLYV